MLPFLTTEGMLIEYRAFKINTKKSIVAKSQMNWSPEKTQNIKQMKQIENNHSKMSLK
jgi:hypothetical protein